MSIFGTLATLPLPETLTTLRNREGALSIQNMLACPNTQLFIQTGVLREFYIEDNQISDYTTIQTYIQRIIVEIEGDYTFIEHPLSPKLSLNIPLSELIIETPAKDQKPTNQNLPHRQTRFRLIRKPHRGAFGNDTDLLQFYTAAFRWLKPSSSAEELAGHLSISCIQSQFYLHQLRTLGLIAPVRAFSHTTPQGAISPARRTVQNTSSLLNGQDNPSANLRKDNPITDKSQSSMVFRLLQALKGA